MKKTMIYGMLVAALMAVPAGNALVHDQLGETLYPVYYVHPYDEFETFDTVGDHYTGAVYNDDVVVICSETFPDPYVQSSGECLIGSYNGIIEIVLDEATTHFSADFTVPFHDGVSLTAYDADGAVVDQATCDSASGEYENCSVQGDLSSISRLVVVGEPLFFGMDTATFSLASVGL